MQEQIKINDYVVCIEHCSPVIKDEVIKVINILNNTDGSTLYEFKGYKGYTFKSEHFRFYDYYNIPYTDGTYPKGKMNNK